MIWVAYRIGGCGYWFTQVPISGCMQHLPGHTWPILTAIYATKCLLYEPLNKYDWAYTDDHSNQNGSDAIMCFRAINSWKCVISQELGLRHRYTIIWTFAQLFERCNAIPHEIGLRRVTCFTTLSSEASTTRAIESVYSVKAIASTRTGDSQAKVCI